MSEDTEQVREAYVIFVPGQGFMKNRRGDFVDDFSKARLFGRQGDATNSMKMTGGIVEEQGHAIPVDLTLDPRRIFKAVLKGK